MGENKYQQSLVRRLRELFPGCVIVKGDSNFLQGIPDLIMLWRDRWAALECKGHGKSGEQPNQQYYVNLMDAMSFASFISPENEEEVLSALQQSLGSRRTARVSQRQQVSLDQLRRRSPGRGMAERAGSQERH